MPAKFSPLTIAVSAVLVAALSGVGTTYALWNQAHSQTGGVITNGDLQLDNDAFSWQETTPAKSTNLASGTTAASVADFLGVNGDEVELRYRVTAVLTGDNLQAEVNVAWTPPAPTLPSGLSVAGYRVYDGELSQLVPLTALGTQSQPEPLESTGPGGTVSTQLVIAVVVRWSAAPTYTGDFTSTTVAESLTELPITVTLTQVR